MIRSPSALVPAARAPSAQDDKLARAEEAQVETPNPTRPPPAESEKSVGDEVAAAGVAPDDAASAEADGAEADGAEADGAEADGAEADDLEAVPDDAAGHAAADWQATLGSAEAPVSAAGLAVSDDGVVFAAGTASAGLDGSGSAGSQAVLAAYASLDGTPLFSREIGSPDTDAASAVASRGGVVALAGSTRGALGGPQLGFGDAFVSTYSTLGEPLWTRQLGSAEPDAASGTSIDASGNVLVVGDTRGVLDDARQGTDSDAFVAKLDDAGELLFLRQLGSQRGYDDVAVAVAAADDGRVLIAGRTFGALQGVSHGSADAFVACYSGAGALEWTAQLGAADYDAAEAITVDASGAIYVAGQAGAFLAGGPGTIVGGWPLLAKYSAAGALLWTLELTDAEMGSASALVIDANGDAWIAGHTSASFAGPSQGAFDSFVARVSPDGELRSARQLGGQDNERAAGLGLEGERLLLLARVGHTAETPFESALLSGLSP